jgi:cytochrome bd ubiquinol oxidase subunit II
MIGTIWFWLVAAMLSVYVVLDGFDIGAGILHLWVARNDVERRTVIQSIGPVWDGNEVWLIAAGGTLYFAFPLLYATSFSGFYLPLIMVLWLLVARGVSLEFRGHLGGPIWPAFFDVCFSAASVLLAVFFGAALGNVVRGVPLDSAGHFFEPLWTNFSPVGQTGILDWFTILVGVAALAALALHGATWLAYKTVDDLYERALSLASRLWWCVALLTVAVTYASFHLLPRLLYSFRAHPWGIVLPIAAIAGLLGSGWFVRLRKDDLAFGASCVYLVGMLASVAFSLYPSVLPTSLNPIYGGLTVSNAKAADYGLKIGLAWWLLGMALATAYTVFTYRNFAGKVGAEKSDRHSHY